MIKNTENKFSSNETLNEVITTAIFMACIFIPYLILIYAGIRSPDPLARYALSFFVSSVLLSVFFYQGNAPLKFAKGLGTFIVLSLVWYFILAPDARLAKVLAISCLRGHNDIACYLLVDKELLRDQKGLESTPAKSEDKCEGLSSSDCWYKEQMTKHCKDGSWHACKEAGMDRPPLAQKNYNQYLADEAFIKKHQGGLSPEDQAELERLDREIERKKKIIEGIQKKHGG